VDGLGLSADQVLTTTRSVRKRLDFERPVERAVIEQCLEIALQAPTGSNTQGWQWVFVSDPDLKARICDLYGTNFDAYAGKRPSAFAADDPRTRQREAVLDSAVYLRQNFHRAPWLLIPCIQGRLGVGTDTFTQASAWGSVIPAVWSFMLALRERGLGSAWTTLHLPDEREVAGLLGIPYETHTQVGLFPIAYTVGTDFQPAKRIAASQFSHWDRW
jgi:nitroreductase